MRCPRCQAESPTDTSFCGRCGAPLPGSSEREWSFTRTTPPPAGGPAPGRTVAGKYRLLGELGRGGMGLVFKAEDVLLRRTVAVKFLAPFLAGDTEHRSRFLREARTASALNHPHICVIHEIGEDEGRPFIAMEYVTGRSLREVLSAGPMAAERVVEFGLQIVGALEQAHARGIVHRDLKTSNVMITAEDTVKVLDFGLAKRLGSAETEDAGPSQTSLTAAGTFLGTLHYAAPEVLRGEPADARSDLWSMGVILYEMAAGRPPFAGPTEFALTSAILKDLPAPLPPQVSPRLRLIILRCLEKDPGKRCASAGELRQDLESIASADRPRPADEAARRHRTWRKAGFAALALVLVMAGAWILSTKRGPSRSPGPEFAVVSTGGRASGVAEANEYFERAMMFLGPRFDLARSRSMLERALELDPKFAEARAWYGFTFVLEIDSGFSNDSSLLYKAEEQLKQAQKDDLSSPRIHSALAGLYIYQGRKDLVFQEASKALALNPRETDAKVWLGNYYSSIGEPSVAKALFQEVLDEDPLFFPARMNLGVILRDEGDMAGAIRELEKILDQDPNNVYALLNMAFVYMDLKDLPSARRRLEDLRRAENQSFIAEIGWGILLALEGRSEEARKAVGEEALKYAALAPWATTLVAEYHAVLGEPGKALDWLERAVRNGDERADWFRRDPLLAPLRDTPRFSQILDSIALRGEARASAKSEGQPVKR
jgi:serine/threonine protein kinase/tetratricopeptide (TPR) repeat protein